MDSEVIRVLHQRRIAQRALIKENRSVRDRHGGCEVVCLRECNPQRAVLVLDKVHSGYALTRCGQESTEYRFARKQVGAGARPDRAGWGTKPDEGGVICNDWH